MSTQDRELFYNTLFEVSTFEESKCLIELFKEDFIKDTSNVNWILQKAMKNKDSRVIHYLLSSGRIEVEILSGANQTAIHLAVYNDFLEIVDFLFLHCNNNINYTDIYGLTHFHIACMTGNFEIAKNYLINDIDPNIRYHSAPGDERGFTPLHFAVKYVQIDIVKLLLEYGANPNNADDSNIMPLRLVCHGISRRIKKHMKRQSFLFDDDILETLRNENVELEVMRLLVQYNGNVNSQDRSGNAALFFIFQDDFVEEMNTMFHPLMCNVTVKRKIIRELHRRQKEKIEFLLFNKANVKLINSDKDTVLHAAINDLKRSRRPRVLPDVNFDDDINVQMIELFLRHGADVEAKNARNESPLQIAVSLLSFKAVKVLVDYNADVTTIRFDYENRDCFYYFLNVLPCLEATENLIKIIRLLMNRGLQLSQNDNLAIIKFFVRNNHDCRYADSQDENAIYKLKNLLDLGLNIGNALEKYPKNIVYTYIEQSTIKQMINQLCKHLQIVQIGNLYISDEIRDCLKLKILTLRKYLLRFLGPDDSPSQRDMCGFIEEIKKMRVTMLNNYTSLHDVLIASPWEIYSCINSCDYKQLFQSDDFKRDFPNYAGIIKGHFAKSLVRHYVSVSAYDYLRSLISVALPDLCCEIIVGYLNNENLMDLCLATRKQPSEHQKLK